MSNYLTEINYLTMEPRQIIEKWRTDNHKEQKEMAELLGLKSQQNYNDIKQGRTKYITLDIAKRFMDMSGINLLESTVSRNVSHETRNTIPHKNLDNLIDNARLLNESHYTLVKNNNDLIQLYKGVIASQPTKNDGACSPMLSNLLELIADVGTGKRWGSKREALAELNKFVSDIAPSGVKGGTQKR